MWCGFLGHIEAAASGRAIQERFESDSKAIRIPRGDSARLAYGFRSDSSATTSPLYNIKTYLTILSGPRGEGAGKRDSRILPSSGLVLQRTEEVLPPPGPFGAQRTKEKKTFLRLARQNQYAFAPDCWCIVGCGGDGPAQCVPGWVPERRATGTVKGITE